MKEIKNIFTAGTAKSPHIDFNRHTGELILSGKSIPENAAKVYEPLLSWIEEYVKSPCRTTNIRLNLEYFNSATSIWIAKLIRALSQIDIADSILFIHLYFDLEDFDSIDSEELKDIVGALVDNISNSKVSIGIKTYGTGEQGKIVMGSTVLI